MRMTAILLGFVAGVAAFLLPASSPISAQAAAALSGQVSSAREGLMEGVVVSAKQDGSTITVSVVSDDKGQFSFPAARLDPGHYAIGIRAVGYDLDGPKDVTLSAGQESKLDLKLKPAQNLGATTHQCRVAHEHARHRRPEAVAARLQQLPHAGTHRAIDPRCRRVHAGVPAHGRLLSGQHAAATAAARRRRRAQADLRRGGARRRGMARQHQFEPAGHLVWPLKTLPRLTGKSTHVIITEYDLPNRLIEPHDVVLDHEGNVWYSDFGQMFIGEMDPKTGKVTQYPIPVTKPGYSLGTLDLEIDKDDNPWIGVMYQSAIAKFDRKTGKFEKWSTPKEWDSDAGQLGHLAVEGTPADDKVWIKNSAGGHIYRLDLAVEQVRGYRLAEGSAHRQAHRHLRHPCGCARTIFICSISRPATSCGSTPRPRSRRSI